MNFLLELDWKSIFVPSVPLLEIVLRGSIVYLFLFFLLRILRRQAGALDIQDLLVVVLLADAAQNAMASEYKSITDGLILVSTIIFWDYLLNWLDFRFPKLRHVLRPSPSLLIKNGRLQRYNMRRELITEEELMEKLREQGIDNVAEVEESYLEPDGQVSVITKDANRNKGKTPKKRVP
jgi:uncharacterized membrane protein YcaP (DUF421 family)